MDPYKILGIDYTATDEEVKKAYRALSKKYHPDANINSPNQEVYTEKFKEVQSAYKTIMDQRKHGTSGTSYQQQSSYQQYYDSGYQQTSQNVNYQNIVTAINNQQYQQALSMLDQIRNKDGNWFYLSAVCHHFLGNSITALDHAKVAVQFEPYNMQYIMLLQQIQSGRATYQQRQTSYGNPFGNIGNLCYQVLLMQIVCSCCCGTRGVAC